MAGMSESENSHDEENLGPPLSPDRTADLAAKVEKLAEGVEYDANGVPRLSPSQADEFVRLMTAPSVFSFPLVENSTTDASAATIGEMFQKLRDEQGGDAAYKPIVILDEDERGGERS